MTPEDRPSAVRAWQRRPLFWGLLAAGFGVWLFWLEERDSWRADRVTDDGLVVEAVADDDWDGEPPVVATYVHPNGGALTVEVEVRDRALIPEPGEIVSLTVAGDDPTTARVVGDERASMWSWSSAWYLIGAVPAIVGWIVRRRSLRSLTELAGAPVPAFQMRGVGSSPGWWSRRWRLHLYPLDAEAGTLPACTVPLIAPPSHVGERVVEVKGQPRPWGRVAVRDQATGELLWPSGRCLRAHGWSRRALEPGRPPARSDSARWLGFAALAVTVAGLVADVFVDDASDVGARDYRVHADVVGVGDRRENGWYEVDVRLVWVGEAITATVATPEGPVPGERIQVALDPRRPSRVWGLEEDPPGGNLIGGIYFVALTVGASAVVVRLSDRRRARRPLPPRASAGVFTGRGGPSTIRNELPPYAARGTITIDDSGLRWEPAPKGRWWELHRWGERPREPETTWISWREVSEIHLEWLGRRRRNLILTLQPTTALADSAVTFGDVDEDDALDAFERLGCRVERGLNRSDKRISLPGS